jgi:cysteine desulfurase
MHKIYLNASELSSAPQEVNVSLQALYALLGAGKKDAFHFTTSAGAAFEQICLFHHLNVVRETGRNHILILDPVETHVERSLKQMELLGWSCKKLPVNHQGQLVKQTLIEAIRPRTSLVSLSWVHGLTGVIQPIHEIAALCKENGIRLHVNATFALGSLFFRFQDLDVDALSLEGAFLKAPLGTAGFLMRAHLPMERKEEPSHWGVAALVRSLDTLMHHFDHLSTETARLRDKLEKKIQEGYPEAQLLFQDVERLPTVAVIAFPGIASDALHYLLQKKGIYTSIGGGYFPTLFSVLTSYGISPLLAHSALQFHLSHETTEEEVDKTIAEVVDLVKKTRLYSKEIL